MYLNLSMKAVYAAIIFTFFLGNSFAQGVDSDGLDGRFAIGVEDMQILYGYPDSQPTSYFIIRIEGPNGSFRYGTNKTRTKEKATLLKSRSETVIEKGTYIRRNRYQFSAFSIIQDMIPLNSEKQPALPHELVRMYQVKYEIRNIADGDFKMGFAQFLDFKIDDNDACRMEYESRKIEKSEIIITDANSNKLKLYQKDYDKSGFAGTLEFQNDQLNISPPSRIYLGDFRDFDAQLWDWKLVRENYLDAAVMLNWEDELLSKGASVLRSFAVGLPDFVEGGLTEDVSKNERFYKHSVFFGLGGSQLSDIHKASILNEIKGKKVVKVFINGFSDKVGTDEQCQLVSERRVAAVKHYLEKIMNEANVQIETLAFGSSRAGVLSKDQLESGIQEDRRVDLIIQIQ
jgi:outer membrane protein OmpA-like peptidoglycan-associated protein